MPKPLPHRKPFLIGQAPSRLTQDRDGPNVEPGAFTGRSGNRLAAMLGVNIDELLAAVEAVNIFDRYPGAADGKGDLFPMAEAKQRAAAMLPRLVSRTAILAGNSVAEAFGVDLSPLESRIDRGIRWLLLPHPSPVNLFWNSLANREAAVAMLRRELWPERFATTAVVLPQLAMP